MSGHLRSASKITFVTLGSRVLGFVRDVVMVQMLNFSGVLGTFVLAWMIPNLLRRLFGEGALAASFIPEYARRNERDPASARGLLASVTGLLLVSLGSIAILVSVLCLVLPAELVGQLAQESDTLDVAQRGALALDLTLILFPYAIPICLTAVFAGALNTHGIFALPAASPILLNCLWLAALGLAAALAITDAIDIVTMVAVALLVGGFAQMALSLVPLLRRRLIAAPRLPKEDDGSMAVLRAMGPTIIGMSLVQINTMLDQAFAYAIVSDRGLSFIYVANRLLLFPHALTSLAIATAVFPRFARLGSAGDLDELRKTTDQATHHTLLVAVPAAAGMILVGAPLIDVMFASEQSSAADLATANLTTIYLVASLPAIGVAQLHARTLYALDDYRTPAWMSFWLLLLNLILNVVFVIWLSMGVPGLVLATTIAAYANAFGLRQAVKARCSTNADSPIKIIPIVLATAAMAAAVYGLLAAWETDSRLGQVIFDLAIPILAGMATYGLALYLFGQRNLRMR